MFGDSLHESLVFILPPTGIEKVLIEHNHGARHDSVTKQVEDGFGGAIDIAIESLPDLIILDVNMPEMDGFQTCRKLKQDQSVREIPVLFLSALNDIESKINGFEAGGVDYVDKPFNNSEISIFNVLILVIPK